MHKVIGRGSLLWNELIDVLLEVETQVNRRPLNYVEDNPDLPILTPATFLFQRTTHLPEEQTWRIPDKDLRRRARFLQTCKDHMWTRWQREYLTALRERHNLFHKTANHKVKVGDAVIVQTDNKNHGKWPLAVVQQIFLGHDGYTRAVQLRTTKGVIDNQRSDRKTSTAPIPSRATVRDHGTSSSAVKPSRRKFQTKAKCSISSCSKNKGHCGERKREMNFRLGISN